jgi:hypothetical protein
MNKLYLSWQETKSRRWFPVGQLIEAEGKYHFTYVQGVQEAQKIGGFQAFPSFPEFDREYHSAVLFPLFANRVMPVSRPDYSNYVQWLHLEGREKDPMAFLAQSNGQKVHDPLEVFPDATQHKDGSCTVHFFARGHRHMSDGSQQRAEKLRAGEPLLLQWDMQNPVDGNAVSLRTGSADTGDADIVGFCPRYIAEDILKALVDDRTACHVEVVKVNLPPAPAQFRVLCRLNFTAASGVRPFSGPDFKPLTTEKDTNPIPA